jgi:hypothetical protein
MNKVKLLIARWLIAPRGLDADTADLVVRFSRALADKFFIAQEKYGYANRWLESGYEWPEPDCADRLLEHLAKGDPRDVAAYCAFLWHFGLPTRASKIADNDLTENVLQILYQFARSQQDRRHNTEIIHPFAVSVNLRGVREALRAVLRTFGYEAEI